MKRLKLCRRQSRQLWLPPLEADTTIDVTVDGNRVLGEIGLMIFRPPALVEPLGVYLDRLLSSALE